MYSPRKEEQEKQIKYILLAFLTIVLLKVWAVVYENSQLEKCYYYPAQSGPAGTLCFIGYGWTTVQDLDNERKNLFKRAQAGDTRARQKLNRLNYEEQLRKQKLRK